MKLQLYYSPGACSLASHIALEEAGASYEPVRVAIADGEHTRQSYLELNPMGRVPALSVQRDGEEPVVVTENHAILNLIADLSPEASLLPDDLVERARCRAFCNWLASSVHICFAQIWRSGRFTDEQPAHDGVVAKGRATLLGYFDMIDKAYAGRDFAFGGRMSIADPYALVMWRWARRIEAPTERWPAWGAAMAKLQLRPAVQRAVAREGITI